MKRIIAILLTAVLCLGLCACAGAADTNAKLDEILTALDGVKSSVDTYAAALAEEAEAAAAAEAEAEALAAELAELHVDAMVLNGTTGFGMAKLMADAAAGEAALDYSFSVETDASNITAALISGDCDIAALPTNAAAALYNKTSGGIQIAAINTRGVLYAVANTATTAVGSLEDLAGSTVYVPAQNPTFIARAVADAAGADITLDNTYAQPADLRTALAAGEVDLAILPEPMVTIAETANEDLATVLDITALWDEYYAPGSLVQGCVVVRYDFAQEHPEAVKAFLKEYEASIDYLTAEPEQAAQLIEETGVFPQAAVARKAIPNCNVCFLAGEEMQSAMDAFCQIMFEIEPASVGGSVPEADFYFLG